MSQLNLPNLPDTLVRGVRRYVDDLTTPTLRLGVTGLAQSGKTVFITAMVRNLTAGGRLPFLEASAEGRILTCYLEPQPDDHIPRFDYEGHVADLVAAPPRWPQSTRQLSQLRITVEYLPANAIWRNLGPRKLHIDLIDYPGEWLVDLQMLEQSFAEWSQAQMQLAGRSFRNEHARQWLEFSSTLDPDAPLDEDIARAAAVIFTRYLSQARAGDRALGTLGPGRFLMPGDLEGSPMLTFAPLRLATDHPIKPGSLAAMMARRYESYKLHVVQPFFKNHFAKLDRQIVLVDALTALNHGPEAINELIGALGISLRAFRPGNRTWLSRILDRKIDRVAFAAAKADHLPHTSHDRLERALAWMTQDARTRSETAGGNVKALALAAIRATTELTTTDAGEDLICVRGTPMPGEEIDGQHYDGTKEIVVFPGDLPRDPAAAIIHPTEKIDVRFVRFRPPLLSDPLTNEIGIDPWPHIRLDRALQFLIGDYLA